MQLRFMQGTQLDSEAIVLLEKVAMPFPPSHAEAVMPNGNFFGAHLTGGVKERPAGYDEATIAIEPATGKKREFFLTLPATSAEDQIFYDYLRKHEGEAYDWRAILGFIVPEHEHTVNHVICSALITLALRACNWFETPLAAPAHLIDPRDLLLVISGRIAVPM